MDWLYLLAVQGTLKSLLQHHSSKASIHVNVWQKPPQYFKVTILQLKLINYLFFLKRGSGGAKAGGLPLGGYSRVLLYEWFISCALFWIVGPRPPPSAPGKLGGVRPGACGSLRPEARRACPGRLSAC